jgi:N,N'-diacetylchitobiose transport system permease protein
MMTAVGSPTTSRHPAARGTGPGHAAPRRPRRGTGTGNGLPWLLCAPALIMLVGLLGFPLYWMVKLSFQSLGQRQLFTGESPPWDGIHQYKLVFQNPTFWTVVWHTAVFTVVSVGLTVLLGLGVALLMRRVHRWVRLAILVAMMFVWALPQLVAAQAFRWITDSNFGILNRVLNLVTGSHKWQGHEWFANTFQGWMIITALVVWAGVPFLAINLSAGLTQVPKELLEAATVDGATGWQALRGITLPILKPLLIIVTTLSVIWNFGIFTQIWVLRDSSPEDGFQSLSTFSYTQAFGQSKYSPGSAISVITVVILLGIMALYIRQIFKIGDVD